MTIGIHQNAATVGHRRMVLVPADAGTVKYPANGLTGETTATAGSNETAGQNIVIRGVHLLGTGAGTLELKTAAGANLPVRMVWDSGTASAQVGGGANYNFQLPGGFGVLITTTGYWVVTYDFVL